MIRKLETRRRHLITLSALAICALAACTETSVPETAINHDIPLNANREVEGVADLAQFRQNFRDPPKSYRPMVRWFWPGGDVEDAELKREIRLMDEAYIGGAEIQPFRFGLDPGAPVATQARVNDYRTPEFYSHVRAALEEAGARGMALDYTFGSGWPFGGGENITPELAAMDLRMGHQALQGPATFNGPVPWPEPSISITGFFGKLFKIEDNTPADWLQRLAGTARQIAVIAMRGDDAQFSVAEGQDMFGQPNRVLDKVGRLDAASAVDLTRKVAADGTLQWDIPPGNWQLFTFVQSAADARVIGGVGDFPQLILNHIDAMAMATHLQGIGGELQQYLGDYVGSGLRSVFCDSLEVPTERPWKDGFANEFLQRRGYDLVPFLPLLGYPAFDTDDHDDGANIGNRIRHDYQQTVSDLIIENFYQPFADWAQTNGMTARVQAHGAPADLLRIYGLSHIPETESLFAGGTVDFLKLASSAAHVYGRPVTSSESFVWIREEYQSTLEKIKRFADKALTAGVNRIIYGGFPYEYMDRPEPGWYPFVSPFPYATHMNHHNPFWEYIAPLNAYMARIQYVSQTGHNVAPVALYRSQLGYNEQVDSANRQQLGGLLMQAGYNFDHINEHALLQSQVVDGRLVTPGGAVYQQLVLIDETNITLALAQRLAEFAALKLPILFVGERPQGQAGYKDYRTNDQKIRELVQTMLKAESSGGSKNHNETSNVRLVENAEQAMAATEESIEPNLRFAAGDASDIFFFHKKAAGLDIYFLRNDSAEPRAFRLGLPTTGAYPEVWDAWTGDISPQDEFVMGEQGVELDVNLEAYASRLIVLNPVKRNTVPVQPSAPIAAALLPPLVVEGRWELELTPGSSSPDTLVRTRSPQQLADWAADAELKHFSGKGQYTIGFELEPAYLAKGLRIMLDLGRVGDVAEIRVNGKTGPTLLMRPYRANVTSLLKPGRNELQVTVTNALLNGMIGAGKKLGQVFAYSTEPPQPLPSGLIGPVRLVPIQETHP